MRSFKQTLPWQFKDLICSCCIYLLLLLFSINLSAQQTGIVISLTNGAFEGDNSWQLVDVTTSTTIASVSTGNYTTGNFEYDLDNGNSIEFRAFDSFGDGWGGATVTIENECGDVLVATDVPNGFGETYPFVVNAPPPSANCSNITVPLDATGNATIVAADVDGGSCSPGTPLTASPTSFTCDDIGINTVVLTAGNGTTTVTCNAMVTIEDNISPTALCQPFTIQLDGTGNATITAADIDGGSSDNCLGNLTLTAGTTMFDATTTGDNTVVLTASDGTTTATCDATVTIIPQNDDFMNAIPVTCGQTITGTTTSATATDAPAGCAGPCNPNGNGLPGVGVWYTFVGNGQTVTVNTNLPGTDFNAQVGIYDGLGLACVEGAGNSLGLTPASVTFNSLVGTTYFIYIDGNGAGAGILTGNFQMAITCCDAAMAICQPDFNVNLSAAAPGTAAITTAMINNGSTGNCAGFNLSLQGAPITLTCANVGVAVPVTLVATDGFCGITSTCVTNVTAVDNTPPTASCLDFNTALDATGNVTITVAQVNGGSTDNCPLALGALTIAPSAFTCANVGVNPVTLTVNDGINPPATCISMVTVQDNIAPVANCQNITVPVGAAGSVTVMPTQINNASTDNCAANLTFALDVSTFDCTQLGANPVVLTVSDGTNTATCNATVTVNDLIIPTANCTDITVNLDATGNATITAAQVGGTSTDNCGANLVVTAAPLNFTCANIGANNVLVTASDGFIPPGTCTAVVTVVDNIAPTALCQDVTVNLDATGNAAVTTAQINNGSTDNCPGNLIVTAAPLAFTCANVGANTVTLTATDGPNTSTANCTVTVVDNIAPTALCQPNINVPLNAAGMATITAAQVDNGSTDNCPANLTLSIITTQFTCADIGQNLVVLSVSDGTNTSTCPSQVTIIDNIAPVANCTNVTTQLNAGGMATVSVAQVNGGATDNCGANLTVTATPLAFTCANVGANNVTVTVNDGQNPAVTCTAVVTVQDNILPAAMCNNITAALDATGNATITAAQLNNGSSDNCTAAGALTLAASMTSFTCANEGTNPVILTVTDGNGNSNTCTSIVTVPTVTPNIITATATDESCLGTNDGTITVAANGGTGAFSFSIDGFATSNTTGIFTMVAPGTYTVSVRNQAGAPCTATAMVTVASGAACEPSIADPCSCLNNSSTINLPAGIGGDDGGFSELVAISGAGGAPLPAGLTFTVVAAGGGATTTGVFDAYNVPNIGDPQAGVPVATNGTVALNYNPATQQYEIPFVHLDGQGYQLVVAGPNPLGTPGNMFFIIGNTCAYPNPVFAPALPLADICPNAAPIALGGTDPSGIAPNAVTFTIDGAPAAQINPAALGLGTFTVVMTYDAGADALNGIGTAANPAMPGCIQTVTQQVTIDDIVNPVAVCAAPIFVDLDANGMGTITVADVDGGSNDNCGVATVTAAPLTFDCDDLGANNVSLTVTDINGNVDTETCVVTVRDLQAATILCRPNVNTVNDPGICGADVILLPPLVIEENCSITNVARSPAMGFVFPTGTTLVTWTLTDAGGNDTQCLQNVTINDTEVPVIDCGNSFIAYTSWNNCGYPSSLLEGATATDNCGVVSLTDDAPNFFPPGQYMVNYTATDAAGNEATCMQWVKIFDTTQPKLVSCPSDIEIEANTANGANVNWSLPVGMDNCPGPIILVEANGFAPGDLFPIGETEISYRLYDQNGQFVECEFTITVTAMGSPLMALTCMDDLDISLNNAIGMDALGWNPPLMNTNCEQCDVLASDDFQVIGTLAGHQYYTQTADEMTFDEALAYAENIGATVAILEDKKEVPMIENELPEGKYFIGLIDAEGTGDFKWINGDEFVASDFGILLENDTEEPATVILNEEGEWEVVSIADAKANFVFEKVCVELEMITVIDDEEINTVDDELDLADAGEIAAITYTAVDECGNTASCGFEIAFVAETVAYCEPTGIATDEENPYFIDSFSLNDYTVETGDDEGYGDHLDEHFLFTSGEVLDMHAVFAGPNIDELPMYCRIWMDLNNDGDFFDENELVMQGVDIGEAINELTIPNVNQSVENTVMRIAISRLTYAESCGDFLNGEVEDYTISIVSPENSLIGINGNGSDVTTANGLDANMLVYPNPAQDELFVRLNNMESETAILRMYNSVGQLVATQKVATANAVRLDVSSYTSGLYSVIAEADGEVQLTQKFMVERR